MQRNQQETSNLIFNRGRKRVIQILDDQSDNSPNKLKRFPPRKGNKNSRDVKKLNRDECEEKKVNFQLMSLFSLDKTYKKFFKVYNDADLGLDFSKFMNQKTIVESAQDDDVQTENEVLDNGVQTCYKDLLVVKQALKNPFEKVQKALRTFKLWAPLFGGNLPRTRK